MRPCCFLPLYLCGALLFADGARAGGDPEQGRKIATGHCSRCHVIGDYNPGGGIGSTPSFQLLLRMDDWRERFATFYDRRPHPVHVRVRGVPRWTDLPSNAAVITLDLDDIDNFLAFVATLQGGQ